MATDTLALGARDNGSAFWRLCAIETIEGRSEWTMADEEPLRLFASTLIFQFVVVAFLSRTIFDH